MILLTQKNLPEADLEAFHERIWEAITTLLTLKNKVKSLWDWKGKKNRSSRGIHAKNRYTPVFLFGLFNPSPLPLIRVLDAGDRPNSVKAALIASSALVAMLQ